MSQDWMDPAIFSIGPIEVRWYGTLFVLAFVFGFFILKFLSDQKFWPLPAKSLDKFITLQIVSMFLGARILYVFLYNWEYYSVNFLDIFAVWKGGLSFHGALIGMCLSTWWFSKKHHCHFYQLFDSLVLSIGPGLFLGRIGNFINGELYGRVTDSWIGIVFPGGGPFPRHPSQLYEGVLEGLVLFFVLLFLYKRQRFYGMMSSVFLFGYGTVRFVAEFFREPDAQLGYYSGYFTMGQFLCLVMILVSIFVYIHAKKLNIRNPLIKEFRN